MYRTNTHPWIPKRCFKWRRGWSWITLHDHHLALGARIDFKHRSERFRDTPFKNLLCSQGMSIYFSLVLLFSPTLGYCKSESVKLYQNGKYDKALEKMLSEQVKDPENLELKYNIANTHYRLNHFDEAMKSYADVALSGDKDLSFKAYYNSGNVAYRQGKLEEAISYYEHSLEIKPDDEDAKYNLDFVREELKKRINESKNQEKPPGNQDQENKEESSKQENQQKEPSNEGQDQQQASNQKQDQDSPEKSQKENQQSSSSESQENNPQKESQPEMASNQEELPSKGLTSEEAERLLQNLNEERKKPPKGALRLHGRVIPGGKDW